jgi:hypothetical protein
MNKADCLKASRAVLTAARIPSFAEAHRLVIWKGWTGASMEAGAPIPRGRWAEIERAFHTAQMFQWAAASVGAERAYWVDVARRRLPPADGAATLPKAA